MLKEKKQSFPPMNKYLQLEAWKSLRKVHGNYTIKEPITGNIDEARYMSDCVPPIGKYNAIDLDKIMNKMPSYKFTRENKNYSRNSQILKINAPEQYKFEEAFERTQVDRCGQNWRFEKGPKLSYVE